MQELKLLPSVTFSGSWENHQGVKRPLVPGLPTCQAHKEIPVTTELGLLAWLHVRITLGILRDILLLRSHPDQLNQHL